MSRTQGGGSCATQTRGREPCSHVNRGGARERGRRHEAREEVPRLLSCSSEQRRGAKGGEGRTFRAPPQVPRLCAEAGWRSPRAQKGEERGYSPHGTHAEGGGTNRERRGGHTATGRGYAKTLPLHTPFACHVCMQRGESTDSEWKREGEGRRVVYVLFSFDFIMLTLFYYSIYVWK